MTRDRVTSLLQSLENAALSGNQQALTSAIAELRQLLLPPRGAPRRAMVELAWRASGARACLPLAQAAQRLGISLGTLRAELSRNGGAFTRQRQQPGDENPDVVTVRRLA